MVNLVQSWAEEYMKLNPDISIHITGGGSGTGIASMLNGTIGIASISRDLKNNELKKANGLNKNLKVIPVATDCIAIILNKKNPIDTLTYIDLKNIFSGHITNWKQLGWEDAKIILYGRENSSGTYDYFKRNILKSKTGKQLDFSSETQSMQGTSILGQAVALDKHGIGYGGIGYFFDREDIKIAHLKNTKTDFAVSPEDIIKNPDENDLNNKYILSRPLYFCINENPDSTINNFIDFVTSEHGQEIVSKQGFYPLKVDKYAKVENK